jgi:capsular polysaccharide biosynthesis protein
LADLCQEGAGHWRPWETAVEPYETAPLSYRRLADALLFVPSGVVMPAPFVAIRESRPVKWTSLLAPLPGTSRVAADPPKLWLEAAWPRRLVEGPVLSLCHVYGHGYGHWFADALPPLIEVLDLVVTQRLRILTLPLLPWQRRTLELLGVPHAAMIEIGKATVACTDLICHSFGGNVHAQRPGPLLDALYQRLRAAPLLHSKGPRPRLVYASRRQLGSWREFANEPEIESALAALGFVVISPETMTLDEQIAAFSRAEVVVGPHGSALANAGFAPPGCLIVDIVPDQLRHQWIVGLARRLGHRLMILVAARQNGHANPAFFQPFHYRIEPEIVIQRVLAAMQRLGIQPAVSNTT